MSKKYEQLAREIVEKIGGNDNVDSLHHCQTRLRFKLVDDDKANKDAISNLEGVAQVLINGGMFQVVIGMHVAEVYEEVTKFVTPKSSGGDTGHSVDKNAPMYKRAFDYVADFVSSIFSPIIPALAGAGMVKALLALLIAFKWIENTDQTYIILNMIGDATFTFMPILLAYSTAQKLKCNPVLAAVVAGILCHGTWAGLVATGETVKIFGMIPLYLVRYTNSVIPIILVIIVQAPLEKWLNKVIPNAIRLVFVPMIVFLVMGIVGLAAIGPLGDYVGMILTSAFIWLNDNASWAPPLALGAVYPLTVLFGLHHGLAPLGMLQLSQMGHDAIFGPGVLCSNVAQGTASLVVGVMSKDKKTKQIGTSAGITGLMGITEPALYGINFPKKYPLIASLIGGSAGGLFAGLTKTHRFATGSSGLPAVMMYIGDDTMQFFYQIVISLVITISVTAIMTVILSKRYEKKSQPTISNTTAEDTVIKKIETMTVVSPLKGEVIDLAKVDDSAFSSAALGKGIAIIPTNGKVVAPFDGTVASLFPTKHAIGIVSDKGAEVLIHIGLDTVQLNGKYFESHVQQGDTVKVGQTLITFDIEKLKEEGYIIQTPVVITNTSAYSDIEVLANGNIESGKQLLKLIK